MFISLRRYHFAMSNSASATPNLQRPLNQKLAETIIQKTAQLLAAELFTARPRHIRGCCFCSRWDGLSSPTSKRKKSLCIFKYEKSQVKLEVKNLPIMSQPGRDKLGQQCYEPSKDLVSQWAPERAKVNQTESEWAGMSQSEPERAWLRLTSTLLTAHYARQWDGYWLTERAKKIKNRVAL